MWTHLLRDLPFCWLISPTVFTLQWSPSCHWCSWQFTKHFTSSDVFSPVAILGRTRLRLLLSPLYRWENSKSESKWSICPRSHSWQSWAQETDCQKPNSGSNSRLYDTRAMRPWTVYLPFQNLSFLTCKVDLVRVVISYWLGDLMRSYRSGV